MFTILPSIKQLQRNNLLRAIQSQGKWVSNKNKTPTMIVKLQKMPSHYETYSANYPKKRVNMEQKRSHKWAGKHLIKRRHLTRKNKRRCRPKNLVLMVGIDLQEVNKNIITNSIMTIFIMTRFSTKTQVSQTLRDNQMKIAQSLESRSQQIQRIKHNEAYFFP